MNGSATFEASRGTANPTAGIIHRLGRSPASVFAVAVVGWALLISASTATRHQGDLRRLVLPGDVFQHPPVLAGATIPGAGYDGQFFAALATDPLLLDRTTASYLDAPSYRANRVGLPLLAWALGAGTPAKSILIYQLLCWAFAASGVWVVGRWLYEEGRSALWALPLAISGGVVASVLRCLPDAAAASLMLTALWLHKNGRRGVVPVLVFAVLVRETSLLGVIAIGLSELRARRFRAASLTLVIPIAVLGAWRVWVESRTGWTFEAGTGNLAPPLSWVARKLSFPGDVHLAIVATDALCTVVLLAAVAAASTVLRRRDPAAMLYALFAALTACLSDLVAVEPMASARATTVLPMLAVLLATGTARWPLRAVAIGYALVGVGMTLSETGSAIFVGFRALTGFA